ncbi:O-antigen ligase family protein [Flaviflexus salsibiostraticola]|nr:O-antigen ligase family protein [Flaviflexus salsibiostraticola]
MGVGVIGILLAFGSQASLLLLAALLVTISVVYRVRTGPSRAITLATGLVLVAFAAVTVAILGSRESWPAWLSQSDSLSSARHTLWNDALSLWKQNPLVGSGHGTFTPSSELASTTPGLEATHSLVLQVLAELGIIGLVLLAAVFAGGLLLATQTGRDRGAISGAAWTFLAIHSTIDHLEDFPVVALTAGILIGWSGRHDPLHQ